MRRDSVLSRENSEEYGRKPFLISLTPCLRGRPSLEQATETGSEGDKERSSDPFAVRLRLIKDHLTQPNRECPVIGNKTTKDWIAATSLDRVGSSLLSPH